MDTRKALLLLIAVVILVAGVYVYKAQKASQPTTTSTTGSVVCGPDEYSCPCATGNYCLRRGAMCLTPTSACPTPAQ